jgi:CBS domain-containing protein
MPHHAMTPIREVMTPMPVTLPKTASILEAAQVMRDEGIGDVLVVDGERLTGVITDRDIVIRCLADTADPSRWTVGDAATAEVLTLTPDSTIDEAVALMRQQAVRRVPVVEGNRPVGIVTLGDLAQDQDPTSALSDISAAPDSQ